MTFIINGNKGKWEVVIGLEVHAQITSNSKLFSRSATNFGAEPNHNVSLIDAAMPGMLPTINEYCVEQAVRTGLALKAKINKHSIFDRKNYFYADLPQGYQISQYLDPIVGEGQIVINLEDGQHKDIRITRLHLEQDAGKSMHEHSPDYSYIDLNRSGIALMEIVSEPDMRSPTEAAAYMKKLRSILRYIGSCDGDMEKGSMRADANISVRPVGDSEYGTRCEIKNLNSTKFLMKAIEFEAYRQVDIIENGGVIDQETRLFDTGTGETRTMRSKEDAHDYRYFPDPDLLPLEFDDKFINEIRITLPELPDEKQNRYQSEYGLSAYDAAILSEDKVVAAYFEGAIASGKAKDIKMLANWISAELFGRLNKAGITIDNSPVSSKAIAALVAEIENNTISGKIAKDVLDIMFERASDDVSGIIEEKGLKQITDSGEIEKIIDEVLTSNQDKVEQYRLGKDKLFGFFVGQVMKATGGKANPGVVNEILKSKLG